MRGVAVIRTITLALACAFTGAAGLSAQHTMTAGDASALPGETVSVTVVLDNSEDARGFSFGLTHDGAVLAISAVDGVLQGAAVADSNGGDGADFFFVDTDPIGGPGLVVGCVISTLAPIDELLVATDNEIAVVSYDIDALAVAGDLSSIDFSSDLGAPPVLTVVSIAGISATPTTVSGAVSVLLEPIADLACELADPCLCEFTATWTNPLTYDEIEVFADGVLLDTLLGDATSYTHTTVMDTIETLSVVPKLTVAATASAVATECTLDCPLIPDPLAPETLACEIEPTTCGTTVTWTNPELYDSVRIYLDDVLLETLLGDATTTEVLLGDNDAHEICVAGVDACGTESVRTCCAVECPNLFIRADDNTDGVIDVSDPIFNLGFIFLDGTSFCESAMDTNDDGRVDTADVIFSLDYIFQGGIDPAAPFPDCGVDETGDALDCEESVVCD